MTLWWLLNFDLSTGLLPELVGRNRGSEVELSAEQQAGRKFA